MDEERLILLRASVQGKKGEIEKVFGKIEDRRRSEGPAGLESLAYQIHNLYCAFEDLFRVVADFFENSIQDETRFHTHLLWRMKIPIEGVRPALLSEESHRLLDSLRAFRHMFRHAYALELDPSKVALVVQDALKLEAMYESDLDSFLGQLSPGTEREA